MAIKQKVIPDGVYLKISKDVIGWNTIVGPDVIIIKAKEVKLLYLHDNQPNEYCLDKHNQLCNKDNENNDKSHFEYNQNRELNLVSDLSTFKYIQLNSLKIISDKKVIEKTIYGSWGSSSDLGKFTFDIEIDSLTNEHLLIYEHNDEFHKQGRWSIFVVDDFVILEIRLIDTPMKLLMVLTGINPNEFKCYLLDQQGVEKWFVFNRI